MQKIFVLSVGGSLIYPDKIDVDFLKNFKKLIGKYIIKNYKFVIYCGGGMLARSIQEAASGISKMSNEQLDWLGIYSTRLNALLLRYIFGKNAQDPVIGNPNDKIKFKKSIIMAAGWLPGCSTDFDAILIAKNLGIRQVVNMSNVDYVYDKDPRKFKDAKKIERLKWNDFEKLVGKKWKAGMHAPFDPIAAQEAKNSNIKVFIIGKDLENLDKLLEGKDFKGTIIE